MSGKTPDPEIQTWLAGQPQPDLTDPDNPEWTEEDFARAQPPEAFPELMTAIRRGRGAGRKPRKVLVSLRLDPDVVEAYRATGEGWQARINADLALASKARAAK